MADYDQQKQDVQSQYNAGGNIYIQSGEETPPSSSGGGILASFSMIQKAAIAALVLVLSSATLYTLLAGTFSPKQASSGDSSPNVTAAQGDVQITYDNSTHAVASLDVPEYSGKIGNLDAGQAFIDFLYEHDGEVVYLDTYFDSDGSGHEAVNYYDGGFVLWHECPELPPAEEDLSAMYCTGVSFNVTLSPGTEALWGYNQGFQYLKGHWSVTALPGMHQGLLSLTLNAVDKRMIAR